MSDINFVQTNQARLADYVQMSKTTGSRCDYVQGGGGNTSVKLDGQLMAIKASGFRLDQIEPDQAYAVIDYAVVRDFYLKTDPSSLPDIEQAGSAQTKAATQTIEGLPQLRPSVEVGFHSLLETFVLHTHPVYANLAACAAEGAAMAAPVLADLPESFVFVPYINPGAQLTFAISEARQKTLAATGKLPAIIFMQNHGLIITGDDAANCLRLHDEVNQRIASAFGVSKTDWPTIAITAGKTSENWRSATPWLRTRLLQPGWALDLFTRQALYPDQLVFLNGQVGVAKSGSLDAALASGQPINDKCTIFLETGEVFYQCAPGEARTIEETLCAILFINDAILSADCTVCTMNEAGKDFISNWESEKFRKSIAAK